MGYGRSNVAINDHAEKEKFELLLNELFTTWFYKILIPNSEFSQSIRANVAYFSFSFDKKQYLAGNKQYIK